MPARYAAILPVTTLFEPPTVLLGLIPFAAEPSETESTGEASGRVYAVGSIVGVFGVTFLLVPTFEVATGGLLLAGLLVFDAVSMAGHSRESTAAVGLAPLVVLWKRRRRHSWE